jgi:hypothetical protein
MFGGVAEGRHDYFAVVEGLIIKIRSITVLKSNNARKFGYRELITDRGPALGYREWRNIRMQISDAWGMRDFRQRDYRKTINLLCVDSSKMTPMYDGSKCTRVPRVTLCLSKVSVSWPRSGPYRNRVDCTSDTLLPRCAIFDAKNCSFVSVRCDNATCAESRKDKLETCGTISTK